jgi:hypothetical protein
VVGSGCAGVVLVGCAGGGGIGMYWWRMWLRWWIWSKRS